MADAASSSQQTAQTRKFERQKVDLPILIVVPMHDRTKIVQARGNDVSENGLAFFAGIELRIGDNIFIEFTPPYSNKPVRVPATVKNRRGYKYGIQFEADSDAERKIIDQFRLLLQFAAGGKH
jgi:transposase